jgi:hypothetical protein
VMKKTIYVHIGTPKTGTTSIQKFLTKNKDVLLDYGVFYPVAGRCYDSFSKSIAVEDCNALDLCINGGVLNNEYTLKSVLDNFVKSEKANMLLSEECLFLQEQASGFYNKTQIWEILSTYEIKIIVYFRQSVEYLCSLWQEMIKYRHQVDLPYFLENNDYLKNIDNFHALAKRAETKNVIVKTFEKESWVNGDLIDDFLSIVNIKDSRKFLRGESVTNKGFCRSKCDSLLYINRHLGMEVCDQDNYNINKRTPASDSDQIIIESLPDEIIERVSNKYYSEECQIAKNFLNREELFVSKYPKIFKIKRPKYQWSISQESKEELRFIVSSTLQRQILDNQKKLIELQQQLLFKKFNSMSVIWTLLKRLTAKLRRN